jgi:large subunit ribosomal protein L17
MRHRVNTRKLGRTSAHRVSMFRNMVSSLIEHERVETTTRRRARWAGCRTDDPLGKRGDLHARRRRRACAGAGAAKYSASWPSGSRPHWRLHARAAPPARRRRGEMSIVSLLEPAAAAAAKGEKGGRRAAQKAAVRRRRRRRRPRSPEEGGRKKAAQEGPRKKKSSAKDE